MVPCGLWVMVVQVSWVMGLLKLGLHPFKSSTRGYLSYLPAYNILYLSMRMELFEQWGLIARDNSVMVVQATGMPPWLLLTGSRILELVTTIASTSTQTEGCGDGLELQWAIGGRDHHGSSYTRSNINWTTDESKATLMLNLRCQVRRVMISIQRPR